MNQPENVDQLIVAVRALTEALEKSDALQSANTTPSAQVILSVVPISGIVFGFVLLFFYFLWQYRIKKELIKNDKFVPVQWGIHLRTLSLLVGLLSTMVGLPMTILFLMVEGVSYGVLGGLIPFSVGIGLLIFYGVSRER